MGKWQRYKELTEYDDRLLCATRHLQYPVPFKSRLTPEFKFVRAFRLAQAFGDGIVGKILRFKLRRMVQKTGINIDGVTNIGAGMIIGHSGTIVINPNAIIGEDFIVTNGVVIGRDMRGKRAGVPTIGNRVCIHANAVIVGKISIGNDVVIAPNSFVNFDVPSHSIVVGNPATIHPRLNATEGYIGVVER
jgi:serine O-acetyltransferase